MQTFFAPGKILLAGEYTVLLGLEAHAVPVKSGQWLEFFAYNTPENQAPTVHFKALDEQGDIWLENTYDLDSEAWRNAPARELDAFDKVLHLVGDDFWEPQTSYRLETRLEFGRDTGLGSSSTFIALMSQCFRLDPQKLQEQIFAGSGYDVAVACLGKPLSFWRNEKGAHYRSWKLPASLTQDWHVVFLGEKVNSRKSASAILQKLQEILAEPFYKQQFERVLNIVRDAETTASLEAALEMYQLLLAQLLEMETPYKQLQLKPVKQGLCKWLGAWGGDMLLVNQTFLDTVPDFNKTYHCVPWNEIVCHE